MKTATLACQILLRCQDQRLKEALVLDKKKMMIGSSEGCDLRLSDGSVSSYHAFILVKEEGLVIKDLFSEAGVFVNGQRVEESYVSPGDVLTIGTMSFAVEAEESAAEIFDADENISVLAPSATIELPPREGLVFIDGEYCDILFDESDYRPLDKLPEVSFEGEYVELEATVEPLDIVHSIKDKRLEVISYVNGLMLDISYLSLKDGEYCLDPMKKGKFNIPFHTLGRTKLFSVKDGQLRFFAAETIVPSMDWDKINLNEVLFLTHGAEQISLRFVEKATGWRSIPLFYRDRNFFKQGGKIFASVFLPLLMLLFFTPGPVEEVKDQVAVVYKLPPPQKPTEAQERSDVAATEVTSKTENTGHKENNQPDTKVEFAAASAQKKVAAKAQSQPAPKSQPVETPPVKAYEFNSSVAMGSLVANAPKINTESNSKSALQDASFNTGSDANAPLVAGADIGVSKFNGSDKKGSGSGSYGSRGLASKSGFDSSYLEPKTVVLGSMDPELLRKILREYIPQFRHCYQQELIATNDKLKGIIDLNFTIDARGKVSKYNIKIKDARFSKKGQGCMGQVLSVIEFPKPKGGGVVDVRQPLNFFAETERI